MNLVAAQALVTANATLEYGMMDVLIFLIAVLMVLDSLFVLFNISKVEFLLHKFFPNLNIRKLALAEGIAGAAVLLSMLAARIIYR